MELKHLEVIEQPIITVSFTPAEALELNAALWEAALWATGGLKLLEGLSAELDKMGLNPHAFRDADEA